MKNKFDILFEEVQNFLVNPVNDEELGEEEIDKTVCRICEKPFTAKESGAYRTA